VRENEILKIKVIIRKFKCHKKISWVWFVGNDIRKYGLILTTADSRKNYKFFIKIFVLISSTVSVQTQAIVGNIVTSKSYPRNLLVAFKFSNYHFKFQNCHFRALFCWFTAHQAEIRKNTTKVICFTLWAFFISKMTFLAFLQKKALYQNVEKHPFSTHLTQL
jgi:hypothetical protein